MQYQEMPPISRAEAEAVFAADETETVCQALIRLAFHEPDGVWVEQQCFRFAHHPNSWVRRTAAICLGHLARIHGTLTLSAAVPLLNELLRDAEVAGAASDALDDINTFILSKRRR